MKTLIVCVLLSIGTNFVKAQEVTQLDEAKVTLKNAVQETVTPNSFIVEVKEAKSGEFMANPMEFVKRNFEINDLISEVDDRKYDSYQVTFTNRKGALEANYSNDGELLSTSLNFKDVIIPVELREKIYVDYSGWSMVKNKYIASGKSGKLDKEVYHIKLKKGNKTQKIKLQPTQSGAVAMAGI